MSAYKMKVPSSVSECLFAGISERLGYIERIIELKNRRLVQREYKIAKEALDWYSKYCHTSVEVLASRFVLITDKMIQVGLYENSLRSDEE